MAGVTGFCVVSAAVTQRTGSSAGHRKLHEAVTRHNAALFNLHRLSLHTPLLSHARASQYAKRAAHITSDCTQHSDTQSLTECDRHSGAALARSARGVRLATPRILPFGAPSPPASPRHRGRGACPARVTASVLRPHPGLLLDRAAKRWGLNTVLIVNTNNKQQ